jgi:hypothetical protein
MEDVTAGWQLTAITCTPGGAANIDLAGGTADISVGAGETVTCTFQNRTGGSLPSTGSGSGIWTVLRIGGIILALGLVLFGAARRRRALRDS